MTLSSRRAWARAGLCTRLARSKLQSNSGTQNNFGPAAYLSASFRGGTPSALGNSGMWASGTVRLEDGQSKAALLGSRATASVTLKWQSLHSKMLRSERPLRPMARIKIIGRTQFGQSDGIGVSPCSRGQHHSRGFVQTLLPTHLIKEEATGLTKGARHARRIFGLWTKRRGIR